MVVRTRKAVIMAAPEVNPGIQATIDPATDALQTQEPPTFNHTTNPVETEGTTGTLTREPAVPGESEVSVAVKTYVRGSGNPTTKPRWGTYLEACGFREEVAARLLRLEITKIPADARFWIGERVSADGVLALVVGFRRGTTSDFVYVWPGVTNIVTQEQDTVGTDVALVGLSSGVTAANINAATPHGILWRPNDVNEVAIALDGSAETDVVIGETLIWQDANSNNMGAATVLDTTDLGGGNQGILVAPMYGKVTVGDRVYSTKQGAQLVESATPLTITDVEILRGAGLTMRHNVDGLDKVATGCRGDMSFEAQAGKAATFTFQYQGSFASAGDIPRPASINFGTLQTPPRAVGGSMWLDGLPLVVQSIGLAMNNSVSQDPDGNARDGLAPAEVDDRNPTWSIAARLARHGGFPWDDVMRNQETKFVSAELGSTEGNYVTIVTARAQVRAAPMNDQNGKQQVSATLNAVRSGLGFTGDDEILICHL